MNVFVPVCVYVCTSTGVYIWFVYMCMYVTYVSVNLYSNWMHACIIWSLCMYIYIYTCVCVLFLKNKSLTTSYSKLWKRVWIDGDSRKILLKTSVPTRTLSRDRRGHVLRMVSICVSLKSAVVMSGSWQRWTTATVLDVPKAHPMSSEFGSLWGVWVDFGMLRTDGRSNAVKITQVHGISVNWLLQFCAHLQMILSLVANEWESTSEMT